MAKENIVRIGVKVNRLRGDIRPSKCYCNALETIKYQGGDCDITAVIGIKMIPTPCHTRPRTNDLPREGGLAKDFEFQSWRGGRERKREREDEKENKNPSRSPSRLPPLPFPSYLDVFSRKYGCLGCAHATCQTRMAAISRVPARSALLSLSLCTNRYLGL